MSIKFGKKQFTTAIILAVLVTAAAVMIGGKPFIAKANTRATVCYKIPSQDTPFTSGGTEHAPSHATGHVSEKKDIWCYKQLEEPQGAMLVYQVDSKGRTRPELSLMVKADGTLTHASLNAGKLTVHGLVSNDFNPIGAPLTVPENAERVDEPIAPTAADSPDEGIRIFQEYGDIAVDAAIVRPGQTSATAEVAPWRGYWFPYSTDRLHKGDDSPLAKYDKFIARRAAATNPGSQAWEHRAHNYGVGWSGHCNGWAAASVMTPEPKQPITDPFSGITFNVSDLKGLLIERNYCPKLVFYGRRNYGRPDNDPRDISASTFHSVVTYFVGQLKKPVLLDLMATVPVQNSVISAYTMKTTKTGPNTYAVEMRAKVHLYDDAFSEEVGEARSVTKLYKYVLSTNNAGQVTAGSWISANPDFLWVPLAPGECEDRNPVVDQFWLDEIMRVSKPQQI